MACRKFLIRCSMLSSLSCISTCFYHLHCYQEIQIIPKKLMEVFHNNYRRFAGLRVREWDIFPTLTLCLPRRGQGQGKPEGGAVPGGTLDADLALVALNNHSTNVQPQAQSGP